MGEARHVGPGAFSEWLRQFVVVESEPERVVKDIREGR